MITEKIIEEAFSGVNKYLTRSRAICLISLLLLSSSALPLLTENAFWTSSISSATSNIAKSIIEISTIKIAIITALTFYIAPYLASQFTKFILRKEISRANSLIEAANNIATLSDNNDKEEILRDSFQAARLAQIKISSKNNLHESLILFILAAIFIAPFTNLSISIFISFSTLGLAAYFFSAQELLTIYISKIYTYKQMAKNLKNLSPQIRPQ